jgi:hypothetical protein
MRLKTRDLKLCVSRTDGGTLAQVARMHKRMPRRFREILRYVDAQAITSREAVAGDRGGCWRGSKRARSWCKHGSVGAFQLRFGAQMPQSFASPGIDLLTELARGAITDAWRDMFAAGFGES